MLKQIRYRLPSVREQERIVNALEVQDDYLHLEEFKLRKLMSAKIGLMQDLLSGKVHLDLLLEPEQITVQA
jgi:hypothetical protein